MGLMIKMLWQYFKLIICLWQYSNLIIINCGMLIDFLVTPFHPHSPEPLIFMDTGYIFYVDILILFAHPRNIIIITRIYCTIVSLAPGA